MTPRLAEILAAMIDAALAGEALAHPPERATIRHPEAPRRRRPSQPDQKCAGEAR
jgi:hypothetical protein